MKKIFAFLFASALLATGLISCGGGGDDSSKYTVTAKQFQQGRGIAFLGISPGFYINPTTDTSLIGDVQMPDRTGQAVEVPESSPAASNTIIDVSGLKQSGRAVNQRRQVSLTGGTTGWADVTYVYTENNCAIVTLSVSEDFVDTNAFINAFGLQQKINNWSSDYERFEVQTLGGSNIQFVIDWNSGNAQLLVNISVNAYKSKTEDNTETGDYNHEYGYTVETKTVTQAITRVVPLLQ